MLLQCLTKGSLKMENKLSELMQSTMSNIKNMVEVNNIVGEPIVTPDGITLVPVSKLSFAFGGGGGDLSVKSNPNGFGGGSAAGVKIEPMGFLVVKGDSIRMVNVMPPAQNTVDRVLELAPQIMDKVDQYISKKE